jgi:hypothetical protein
MCIVHVLRRPLRGKQWSLTPAAKDCFQRNMRDELRGP